MISNMISNIVVTGFRSVRECCKSVAVARKQQMQRLGALGALRGARSNVVASRSVAGALQEHCLAPGSTRRRQKQAQAEAGAGSNRHLQGQET